MKVSAVVSSAVAPKWRILAITAELSYVGSNCSMEALVPREFHFRFAHVYGETRLIDHPG